MFDRFSHQQQQRHAQQEFAPAQLPLPQLRHQERIVVPDDDPFAPLSIDEAFNFGKHQSLSRRAAGESKECSVSTSFRKPLVNRFSAGGLRGESEMDSPPGSSNFSSYGFSSSTSNSTPGLPRMATSLRGDDWGGIEPPQQQHQQHQRSYSPTHHSHVTPAGQYTSPDLDFGPSLPPPPPPRHSQHQTSHHQPSHRPPQEMDRIDSLLHSISQTTYPQMQQHRHRQEHDSSEPQGQPYTGNFEEVFRSSSEVLEPLHFRGDHQEQRSPGNFAPTHNPVQMGSSRAASMTSPPRQAPPYASSASYSHVHVPTLTFSSGEMAPARAHMQRGPIPNIPSLSHDDEEEEDEGDSRFKPFHEEKWSHRYKELMHFHQEHGHAAVPHTYPPNLQLARWVKRQRRQYKLLKEHKPSTMTLERLEMLNQLDFVWDSHEVNWREKLMALDKFRREHGHCNVPSNYYDKKLATWVKCQRRQYKLYMDGKGSAMCPERINQLEGRGFEWEVRSSSSKNREAKPPSSSSHFPSPQGL